MNHKLQLEVGINLYTASQVRDIELSYAKTDPAGTYPLMEKAGKAAFETLKSHWPEARKVLVLAGPGNNGGDGFIVARLATKQRFKTTLCNFCEPEKIKGDAKIAYDSLPTTGLRRLEWASVDLSEYDLVIDAMLGTGVKGTLRSPYDQVITKLNQSPVPVLAIDIPSGLEADTGNAANGAVEAELTVTFIGNKRGLYTGDAANYRGKVILASLGIPEQCFAHHEFNVIAENWRSLRKKIKPRKLSSHKGEHGHCVIVGGSQGMTGAALLASTAALRSGAGLTSALIESGAESLVASHPEVMAKNQVLPDDSCLALFEKATCLIIGPGLGQGERGSQWMSYLQRHGTEKFKVFDADALNWLSLNPDVDEKRILTPHPGEAGRLLGISSQEVNQDRFSAAQKIVDKYGGVCVLKGAGTIISDSRGINIVCPVGNPGMATGGMGDVLSGIIGSLIAQGHSLLEAASLGVCVHGEAADKAAGTSLRYRGLLASDLFKHLPVLLNPI